MVKDHPTNERVKKMSANKEQDEVEEVVVEGGKTELKSKNSQFKKFKFKTDRSMRDIRERRSLQTLKGDTITEQKERASIGILSPSYANDWNRDTTLPKAVPEFMKAKAATREKSIKHFGVAKEAESVQPSIFAAIEKTVFTLPTETFTDSETKAPEMERTTTKEFDLEEATATVAGEGTCAANGGTDLWKTYLLVDRRAPLNPFRAKAFRKGVRRSESSQKVKVADPALTKIGVCGRLLVCISTSALLTWNFLFEHVINYTTFNGTCVSEVLYPEYTLDVKPYIVDVGYGACEYNTGVLAKDRCPVGSCASFDGYPTDLVRNGNIAAFKTSWDSFSSATLKKAGALNANLIRNYGEIFRLFWSMYLHAGWLHILINVSCQIQLLMMLEPDWGFVRTLLLFFISGITGNLLSAVCNPCSTTVGSSGALYGLLGGLIPYCIEYWKTIPRPGCFLGAMFVILVIGFITGLWGITDNYAHMGGCLGGILFGFGTISNVAVLDKCTLQEKIMLSPIVSKHISKEKKYQLRLKMNEKKKGGQAKRLYDIANRKTAVGWRGKLIRLIKKISEKEGRPKCKMAPREWLIRLSSWATLLCLIPIAHLLIRKCIYSLIQLLVWLLLFLYLMVPSLYKNSPPPGNLQFSGYIPCHCCQIWNSGVSGTDLIKYNLGFGSGRLYGNEGLWWCWEKESIANNFCNINQS
ncbi:rhomboid protease ROM5 [Cardiosporidium cionae]|uniref:Rhomboid-like protease n=1 Tax=Cardiosporidium cionae TaxID=476202 RepID=A0ABQ7J4M0_9APIC|nr:rhomboid protease ROM5 [Cardiosporidium cionae]|eukprot:KAF8817976.1 rhomboid protease ROM5 [Cardiosporidium cionae]